MSAIRLSRSRHEGVRAPKVSKIAYIYSRYINNKHKARVGLAWHSTECQLVVRVSSTKYQIDSQIIIMIMINSIMDGYRIFESDLLSLPSHMTITQKHNAPQDVYMHSPAWCGSSLTEDAGIIHSTYTQQRQVRWDEQWYISNARVFNTCEIKVQQTTQVNAPLRSIILWCF